jgi:long-subunit fatty acid transport protein
MRILLATLAVAGLALSAGAVQAQSASAGGPDQSFVGVDTDRNGAVSWAEFNLVFPDVTEEQFNQADISGDASLSLEEFDTLQLSTASVPSMAPAPAPVQTAPGASLTYSTPE